MGLIDEILPCQVLIDRMIAEAEAALKAGPSFIVKSKL